MKQSKPKAGTASRTSETIHPVSEPADLRTYEKRVSIEEMKRRVDGRPLAELEAQIADALKQILLRAQAGDDEALGSYYLFVRQAVMSFDNLVKHEEARLRAVAELSSDLPVLLSLNPQTIRAAKERMRLLKVGANAMLPSRAGQRTDQGNFWTHLAKWAFEACRKNKLHVAETEARLASAQQTRVTCKLWGGEIQCTQYTLLDGKPLVIADWQKECAQLGDADTPKDIARWWELAKVAVLDYWQREGEHYQEALRTIGKVTSKEYDRRNWAVKRTRQAFYNLLLPKQARSGQQVARRQ
jgi:hypothetical protein